MSFGIDFPKSVEIYKGESKTLLESVVHPKNGGALTSDLKHWYDRDYLMSADCKTAPKPKYDSYGNFNGTIEEQIQDIQKRNSRIVKKYYKQTTQKM